jgi:uncharacterized protein
VPSDVARRSSAIATELLEGFRALVVNGPRQAGKSTVVRQIQEHRGPVANLDDPALLDLARRDPVGFLAQLEPSAAIDEFQRGGDALLLALKMALDSSRTRGQFLLAGSTRFLTTRTLSETLTGRIGLLELLPLSAGEVRGVDESFVECLFDDDGVIGLTSESMNRADYAEAIAAGGFPELVLGPTSSRFRSSWTDAYVRTVTALANVEEIAEIRRPELVLNLLRQVAARSSSELVVADLARELVVDEGTVRGYLQILDTLYLSRLVPAWTSSRTNRSKRRSVGHVLDTALGCHLLGVGSSELARFESPWIGPLLESFVVGEVAKQIGWVDRPTTLHHYRDRDQREIDIILERGQNIAAIEVKATSTPTMAHAKHLVFLRDRLGDQFSNGVVVHTGTHRLQLADRISAVPVSSLWGT